MVAVGIGVLLALYGLTTQVPRKDMHTAMDEALSSTGLILVVTGCGGAMGAVLKASGAGPQVAEAIASSGIPPLLVPLAIASMLRIVQGSATASMMVAATMTMPLVSSLGLDPLFVALACAVGPVGFSHLNDSYFHIISRTLAINELTDQLKVWTFVITSYSIHYTKLYDKSAWPRWWRIMGFDVNGFCGGLVLLRTRPATGCP